jgi:hypothetical protein
VKDPYLKGILEEHIAFTTYKADLLTKASKYKLSIGKEFLDVPTIHEALKMLIKLRNE